MKVMGIYTNDRTVILPVFVRKRGANENIQNLDK